MHRILIALLISLAFVRTAASADTQVVRLAPKAAITAFVNVNVIPMDSERVLKDQRVLVEAGKIAAVGRAIAIPSGAELIDAHGTYLSPGLSDMHSHSTTSGDLKVYLANGVTSILNMGGASAGFMDSTRPAANAGKIPGPHVYAAFRVDGSPRYNNFFVTSPSEARALVQIAKTNGYQFIKVYNDLSPASFRAIIDEGRRLHVPVVGHGVTAVGLRRQLDMGQVMVAHTEEFLYTVFYDKTHVSDRAALDPSRIPGVIDFVLRNHAFVTADLDTFATIARQWGNTKVAANLLHIPEARYARPEDRLLWAREDYKDRSGSIEIRLAFLKTFTKAMSDAGVPLIAGTDAPSIPGVVPGFSLHDDLLILKEAGLSNYEVLATATRTPGEFIQETLSKAESFGTVTTGSRADLVLTAGDPLADLSTLRHPLGVMAAGHWYAATELKQMLDDTAVQYKLTDNDKP